MIKSLLRQQAETLNMASLEASSVSELGCHPQPTEANPDDMRRKALELRSYGARLHTAASTFDREAGRLEAMALMVESSPTYDPPPEEGS